MHSRQLWRVGEHVQSDDAQARVLFPIPASAEITTAAFASEEPVGLYPTLAHRRRHCPRATVRRLVLAILSDPIATDFRDPVALAPRRRRCGKLDDANEEVGLNISVADRYRRGRTAVTAQVNNRQSGIDVGHPSREPIPERSAKVGGEPRQPMRENFERFRRAQRLRPRPVKEIVNDLGLRDQAL